MVTEEQIRKQLEELRSDRTKFVEDANRQLASINGAITVLEQLLKPVEPQEHTSDPPANPE
uniref:Uncharacterized protein n=1 Tax=viral metagenome TaxID=1070528 RepID=A0A6M3J1H5_9ZZZZ